MNTQAKVVGAVKGIQLKKESILLAEAGSEVAVSLDGAVYGRNIFEGELLYTFISGRDIRNILMDEDTSSELKELVKTIRDIKKEHG
ncbi:MAG: hypothetical protein B6U97_04830 [Candidatus Altiarchaeales archaeon ex4484_96]|nr:MAG: hypothetical protein B6U97_04830 [Candidatus Altiarchaeales archaeon ex4484_96]